MERIYNWTIYSFCRWRLDLKKFMKKIRFKVFETNSSSSHVLTTSIELGTYDIDSLPNPLVIRPMTGDHLYGYNTFFSLEEKLQLAWIYFIESIEYDDDYDDEEDDEETKRVKANEKFINFLKIIHPNFKKVEIVLEDVDKVQDQFPSYIDDTEDFFKDLILNPKSAISFLEE